MAQGPAMGNAQTSIQGRELRVQRTFQAPRELVFQVCTDPMARTMTMSFDM